LRGRCRIPRWPCAARCMRAHESVPHQIFTFCISQHLHGRGLAGGWLACTPHKQLPVMYPRASYVSPPVEVLPMTESFPPGIASCPCEFEPQQNTASLLSTAHVWNSPHESCAQRPLFSQRAARPAPAAAARGGARAQFGTGAGARLHPVALLHPRAAPTPSAVCRGVALRAGRLPADARPAHVRDVALPDVVGAPAPARRRRETCPVSTGRGTRRVQLVREGRGGGGALDREV